MPYRQDPLWPALVHHAYPKKVSYSFFPFPAGTEEPKSSRFSCAPKLTYALVTTEPIPHTENEELKKAHRAACKYLTERGRTRGSKIRSFGEENQEIKVKKEEKSRKRARNDTPSESGSHPHPSITEEQSEAMRQLVNDRLESLVEEIWKSDDVIQCRKQTMKDKMTIKLKNNQFLKEPDFEMVFEQIVDLIRKKSPSISLITAFNLTASHFIPHVLISCYSTFKKMDYKSVKETYNHQNSCVLGLDPSMNIPVTDHLEELCRLACDESDAI